MTISQLSSLEGLFVKMPLRILQITTPPCKVRDWSPVREYHSLILVLARVLELERERDEARQQLNELHATHRNSDTPAANTTARPKGTSSNRKKGFSILDAMAFGSDEDREEYKAVQVCFAVLVMVS